MSGNPPRITVIGSVNLDIVASGSTLPAPGETVTGASLARYPGGKGANQALAARRLGAEVKMIARVGNDDEARQATALLREAGVDLSDCKTDPDAATGVALIAVSSDGENQIVVAPGANETLMPGALPELGGDAVICQMEIPVETVIAAAKSTEGLFCVNLAPPLDVPDELLESADLIIVNEPEAAIYGDRVHQGKGLVAITYGAKGAVLFKSGQEIARAAAPAITPVDTTGAGDSFVGALVVALVEGIEPEAALKWACCEGALTAMKAGAQPSFPTRVELDDFCKEKA